MKTIDQVVTIIEQCRESSAQRWKMAIDTDDANRGFERDRDACLASYDAAIEALTDAYDGYLTESRGHLNDAKYLEAAAGDAQDAMRALAELDGEVVYVGDTIRAGHSEDEDTGRITAIAGDQVTIPNTLSAECNIPDEVVEYEENEIYHYVSLRIREGL